MDNQKTVKCIKCQKETLAQECVETPKGFVCKTCDLKAKKRKLLYRMGGIIAVILLAVVAGAFYFMQNKKNTAIGFEGATNIQDSTSVEVQEPTATFKIETAVAQSSPVVTSQTIDDIESFKRAFAENLESVTNTNENNIIIPAISVFFDFESANINSNANSLLSEYAKTYLQTNKQATLLIQGYACDCGSDDVNDWVSKQRVESVRSTLTSFGIPENKVEIHWYGKSKNKNFSYPNIKNYRRAIVSIR